MDPEVPGSVTPGARPPRDMKIYIDEDLSAGLLIRLLQKAGPDVDAAAGEGRRRS
jgi:hypothetical protein